MAQNIRRIRKFLIKKIVAPEEYNLHTDSFDFYFNFKDQVFSIDKLNVGNTLTRAEAKKLAKLLARYVSLKKK